MSKKWYERFLSSFNSPNNTPVGGFYAVNSTTIFLNPASVGNTIIAPYEIPADGGFNSGVFNLGTGVATVAAGRWLISAQICLEQNNFTSPSKLFSLRVVDAEDNIILQTMKMIYDGENDIFFINASGVVEFTTQKQLRMALYNSSSYGGTIVIGDSTTELYRNTTHFSMQRLR